MEWISASRRPAAVLCAALATAVVAAALSGAAGTPAAGATRVDVARYDGTLSSTGGVAPDVTGAGHDATVTRRNGGTVTSTVLPGDDDPSFVFPTASCTASGGCPQAALVPSEAVNPDPAQTFTFGADVRLLGPVTSAGQNVLQRGLSVAGTPQWKLQVDKGWPSCRWSDGTTVVLLPSGPRAALPLATDTWYRVACSRTTGDVFRLTVTDPATGALLRAWSRSAPAMGVIAPTGPMTIGTKSLTGGPDVRTDQFRGAVDDVFVAVG